MRADIRGIVRIGGSAEKQRILAITEDEQLRDLLAEALSSRGGRQREQRDEDRENATHDARELKGKRHGNRTAQCNKENASSTSRRGVCVSRRI